MENTKSSTLSDLFINPVVKRLSKVKEQSETCATHKGIAKKCLFFMAMAVVGVVIEFIIHNAFQPIEQFIAEGVYINEVEGIGIIVCTIAALVFSIMATLMVKMTPVFGAISCMSYGYIIASTANIFEELRGPVLMALVYTFAIVFSMQLLFSTGKLTFSHKFRTAMVSILIAWVVAGALMTVLCLFVPQFAATTEFIRENGIISIGVSVIGIILAVIFLLFDFDNINKTVENKLPKEYEWCAAFSLSMTIIWLYMEILNLLIKLKSKE